ncbi:MAG: homoserine dehydrogenase [Candidatus Sulfotelmatobacter sp.]
MKLLKPCFNLCFLGFGNVNRTLVRLLEDRSAELREKYGIAFRITGIASRRLGWIADADGLDPEKCGAGALAREIQVTTATADLSAGREGHDFSRAEHALNREAALAAEVSSWLAAARADVLFEATSLNVETGQPAVDHIRAALDHGAHAITANKGPIVHAYRELRDLAAARGKRFLFESTVLDGVPIFSLFDQLPAIHLNGFHGILNSTTNVILGEMENGLTLDEALKKAQSLGVAETDATHDIDGWDAAVKTAALITVLMDIPVRLDQIEREGIRDLTPQAVRNARRDGWPFKLVCRARRTASGVEASVKPEKVLSTQPMARITGTSSYIHFETDIFPGLAITEENPGLYATAYGTLADFVRAVR